MKFSAGFFRAAATCSAAAGPGRLVVIGDSITQATDPGVADWEDRGK